MAAHRGISDKHPTAPWSLAAERPDAARRCSGLSLGMFPEKGKETLLGVNHRPVDTLLREGKRVREGNGLPAKVRCRQEPLMRRDLQPLRHGASYV